jgi:hypothetical protein
MALKPRHTLGAFFCSLSGDGSGRSPSNISSSGFAAVQLALKLTDLRRCDLQLAFPDFTLGSLIPLRDPFSLRGGDPRLVVVFGATDLARDLRDRRVQNRDL